MDKMLERKRNRDSQKYHKAINRVLLGTIDESIRYTLSIERGTKIKLPQKNPKGWVSLLDYNGKSWRTVFRFYLDNEQCPELGSRIDAFMALDIIKKYWSHRCPPNENA